jgi:hypothetical protein
MRFEAVGKPAGCKLIRVRAEITDGIVESISIRGDFFASPEEGFDRAEKRLSGAPLAKIAAMFDALLSDEHVEVFGISGAGIAEVLSEAIAEVENAQ